MKTKFSGLLTLLLVFFVQFTFAQEKSITGTVTDESGLPLPGVNIVVKGTTNGAQTDFDGNYSITANTGETLVFSYVGLKTQEVVVGDSNTINVTLTEDASQLEEVVITAQGIKREKKALGYAVSTVKSEKIEQRAEGDIARVLNGKVSGVNITSNNGLSGSGTNIVIRGYSTVTGSNQPLFIVDGVPFDSGTNTQSTFLDNNSESSRFLDLDPNNIESINVLKGLSATVLYGTQGRNGVILITTKGGSSSSANKKMEVSVTQSVFSTKAIIPDYQDNYGGGFHQGFGFFFSNWGPRFDRTDDDGISNAVQYTGNDAPNGNAILQHPFNFLADQTLATGFEDLLTQPYEYKPYNGVKDFFRTGHVYSTSINIRGGSDKANFNINYGRNEDQGIAIGNQFIRNNFSLGGNVKLSNNLTVSGTFNYSLLNFKSPPNAASFGSGTSFAGAGVFGDVLYTPRSVDLTNIPFQAVDGRSVYYRSGNDIQNPYWTVNNAKTRQKTNRFFNRLNFTYEFNDWINLTYRVGLDTYTELNSYGQNKGGVDGDVTGIFRTITGRNTIWNHDFILAANKDLNESFNLSANLGFSARRDVYEQEGLESTRQVVFGILEHFNFQTQSSRNSFTGLPLADYSEQNINGVYLDATLGYNNYLFLNLAGRYDTSSTLESNNNSIFYPGGSIAFVPTDAFENMKGDVLNYLKVRAGYGSSAGFPVPYSTRNNLNLNALAFVAQDPSTGAPIDVPSLTVSNTLGNPDLKPERVGEFEFGVDTRLFNRLNLNVSVYSKTTTDLITFQTLDDATGFDTFPTNIGEVRSEGIEIDYDVDIVKSNDDGLRVNLAGNFSANETIVTELAPGTENILLTQGVIGEAANYAVEGRPFGVLLGSTILRDANGNRVVGNDGLYLVDNSLSEIGDPNPDWTAAFIPTVRYKGLTFTANIQYRHGGDIYSLSAASLLGRGVVDFDDPICRECNYILPGVLQDGTPNNIAITATNFGFDTYFAGGINELNIYDGSTLRLQEISLAYDLPRKFLDKTPFGSLSFTLSGNNLWFKAFNFADDLRYDTNASSTGVGNGQGIDFITGPSARRYGFSIKATF